MSKIGSNEFGQCGFKDVKDVHFPQLVTKFGESTPISVSCGYFDTSVSTDIGQIFIWGANHEKDKRNYQAVPKNIPYFTSNPLFITKISMGRMHQALLNDKMLSTALKVLIESSKDESTHLSSHIKKLLMMVPSAFIPKLQKRLNLWWKQSKQNFIQSL